MIRIRSACPADLDTIIGFIGALADYEHLSDEVRLDRASLDRHLFAARPTAEVPVAELGGDAVGFALFLQSFSTFAGAPGSILRICSWCPRHREQVPARLCSRRSRGSRSSAAVPAWNGRYSIGTGQRSISIVRSAPVPWTSGRSP